jgi:hypothetical protein
VENLKKSTTRIIGDNNTRLRFNSKANEQGSSADYPIKLGSFNSSTNLNVYSSLSTDQTYKNDSRQNHHVYVDLKTSYGDLDQRVELIDLNSKSKDKNIPENKLFSSSFILVKEEESNLVFSETQQHPQKEYKAQQVGELKFTQDSSYSQGFTRKDHVLSLSNKPTQNNGSYLNLGKRLEQLKAKISLKQGSPENGNFTESNTSRSNRSQEFNINEAMGLHRETLISPAGQQIAYKNLQV